MNKHILVKYCVALISLVLVAVTFMAFEQVRNNEFVNFDDGVYVYENPNVYNGLSCKSVGWAFKTFDFSDTLTGHWMPVSWLSHMLDCQLYGLDPAGLHITSLLFHIANTLLLFWVLKNMTSAIWPSAFVAVLFAVHPLHVESVAWVTERRDVLSLFFWLLTMAAYTRYARQPKVSKYLLVVLFFAISLMSKSMSVTLPFVLLLLDYWPLSRFQLNKENTSQILRLIVEKIPLFIMSAASCAIALSATKHLSARNPLSLSYRVTNAVISYLDYIIKMVCPRDLAALYPNLGISPPVWRIAVSSVILIIISVAAIYLAKKKRFFLVGWLWYLGTLVPVIGLVQIGPQAMADKYTYLPLTGIFIIIAWAVEDLCRRRPALRFVSCVVAMLLMAAMVVGTRRQVGYWKDSMSLSRHAIAVTENNNIMHMNLGNTLARRGQFDEAIIHYRHALRIKPNNAMAHMNLGNALAGRGQSDEAIGHYRRSLQINPDDAVLHRNLGIALTNAGQLDEGIVHYRRALEINPDYAMVHYSIGHALTVVGQFDEAIGHYRRALQIDPGYTDAHSNLGVALINGGRFDEAIDHYRRALQINPDDAALHYNLGIALIKVGQLDEAISHYRRVVKLQPEYLPAFNELAWYLATASDPMLRNPAEAVRLAQKACELDGHKNAAFLDTLAVAYASADRFNEAVLTAEKALELAEAAGNENFTQEIRDHLKLFREGRSYIDKPLNKDKIP